MPPRLIFTQRLPNSRVHSHAQFLISGLGTLVCRHGHLMSLLNVFEGERHAYAIVALEELMKKGVVPNVFWYDINCRWVGPSASHWPRPTHAITSLVAAISHVLMHRQGRLHMCILWHSNVWCFARVLPHGALQVGTDLQALAATAAAGAAGAVQRHALPHTALAPLCPHVSCLSATKHLLLTGM
jgi:Kyakuja-Dileera-Zisupton transposase